MNTPNIFKNPQTNWGYILIVLVLAILAGGGILGYQEWTVKQGVTAPPDETADWKIYRNEDYGFEVKYPPSLIVAYKITDTVIWRHPQDTGLEAPRLFLKVEKKTGITDLQSFMRKTKESIKEISIGPNEKVPEMKLGILKETELGIEYFDFESFDFENGGWVKGIYFSRDSVIVSLESRLHWLAGEGDSQLFYSIINSISPTQ